MLTAGLGNHGDEALRLHPPRAGDRVVDIGCGFGETTLQLADLVGPEGVAVGVDAAPRFIEIAQAEARELGVENASYAILDVEAGPPEGEFDMAFSRFGTMFFANPVAALRNVRAALTPEGKLVMVVWRSKVENDWVYRAQQITERFVTKPEEYDEPTCGPGPFSMANADTASGILRSAGYEEITLRRCDLPILGGGDVEEAVELIMSLGPAGEILRLAGERAAHLHGPIREALREALADWATPDGVMAPASTWIVSATVASDRNGS